MDKINGQKLWRSPAAVRVVYSDASSTWYGGYLVEHGYHVAHGHGMSRKRGKVPLGENWLQLIRVLRAVSGLLKGGGAELNGLRIIRM